VRDPTIPQPSALRAVAEAYYATFSSALDRYHADPVGFTQASERGLMLLSELERDARIIQRVGEQQAGQALDSVEWTMTTAQLVLLGVLGGLGLIGAGLVYATVKVMNEFRRFYGIQQETAQRLAEALKAKSDFIADASHELRTPLTVLRGNAQLALALDSTCAHAELLSEILQEANRLSRLVEDLLLLARADAASLPLVRERLAVGLFLAGLADRAAALAREHGASLRTALEAEGWLEVDPVRIEQAVLALVDNAAKYGPRGGVVVLASEIRGGELVIEVIDHGPGIPPEELPLIFERFYRVDKARSRARGGAGLGLPIAKTIVAAHGGRIEAESHPGQGTTRRICLPLASPAPVPQPASGNGS
jgi:two-component system sensor histidine kinase VicK